MLIVKMELHHFFWNISETLYYQNWPCIHLKSCLPTCWKKQTRVSAVWVFNLKFVCPTNIRFYLLYVFDDNAWKVLPDFIFISAKLVHLYLCVNYPVRNHTISIDWGWKGLLKNPVIDQDTYRLQHWPQVYRTRILSVDIETYDFNVVKTP